MQLFSWLVCPLLLNWAQYSSFSRLLVTSFVQTALEYVLLICWHSLQFILHELRHKRTVVKPTLLYVLKRKGMVLVEFRSSCVVNMLEDVDGLAAVARSEDDLVYHNFAHIKESLNHNVK